jgi:Zn-dependent protease
VFGKSYQILRLAGFSVRVHPSWFIILVLITWSLATGWFPMIVPGLDLTTRVLLGVAGALGLFASILLHELSHAIVARRSGVPTKSITLFLFGGVAEMEQEPQSPQTEFAVAIAGPAATAVIIGLLWLGALFLAGEAQTLSRAVVDYLIVVNIVLLAFNIIPAFPLDGGRVLRSILWRVKGDLRWATRVSARLGGGFGAALIVLGIFGAIGGNLIPGMWMALIGLFLRGAAGMSYEQLLLTRMLQGEPVSRFARSEVVSAPPDITLDRFVQDYLYKHHFNAFPVVENGRLLGTIEAKDIRAIPPGERAGTHVRDLIKPASEETTIQGEQDAVEALAKMRKNSLARLMVVSPAGQLEGVLSLSDLLELFHLKLELEGAG